MEPVQWSKRLNKPATQIAKVCCEFHHTNIVFVSHKIFCLGHFALARLLCRGTTAVRLPYANADVAIAILFIADDTAIAKERRVIKILQSLTLTTRLTAVQSFLVDIKCFILRYIN